MINYGKQSINDDDIAAVVAVLKSDLLTQGPVATQFEQAVASYCGAEYAVAVSNGSVALHLACRAMGLEKGGLLWTSPNSFIASANCALYCVADVDFVDIEEDTGNMSMQCLEEKLLAAEISGHLPDIVIPVHFSGYSCDMKTLHRLAEKYGFQIIEDACHALGGTYAGDKIGSCRYSQVSVFSFHPVKSITSGEGGMLLCNDEQLAQRIRLLSNNGITRDLDKSHPKYRPWHYEQRELGINARLTDIHAALGLSQMRRIDQMVDRRAKLADMYKEHLMPANVGLLDQQPDRSSAWHLFCVLAGSQRDRLYQQLLDNNISANVHYIPIHLQPHYRSLGFGRGDFPAAEAFYDKALTLPLYVDLTEDEVAHVCKAIRTRIGHAA